MSKSQFAPDVKSVFKTKSDYIGVSAGGLCMIHCLITPLLFAFQATSLSCSEISPTWCKAVDYFFLIITFIAIYYTNKTTSSYWMPKVLYTCWAILALVIVNDSIHLVSVPHALIYIPALSLVGLHLYNRRHFYSAQEECCIT